VLNKIKPIVSNASIPLRRMHHDVETKPNFCNLLLTTNFEDCLPLEEDNTRYCVLFTQYRTNQQVEAWRRARIQADGYDYVRELYHHIQERPVQFAQYFREEYSFSPHYAPHKRAPQTEFKRTMAEDAKSDERQLLEQILADGSHPGISHEILLWPVVRALFDAHGLAANLRGRAVAGFLKPLGFVRANDTSVSVDGKPRTVRVWTSKPETICRSDKLTSYGHRCLRRVLETLDTLDDTETLKGNVVPLHPRRPTRH